MMSRGLRNTCSKKTVLAQVFAMQSISGACLQAMSAAGPERRKRDLQWRSRAGALLRQATGIP
jgi:hypothetical protein